MRKCTVSFLYDDTQRLAPESEPVGKALQALFTAAHRDAGVRHGIALAHWKEDHKDVEVSDAGSPPQESGTVDSR